MRQIPEGYYAVVFFEKGSKTYGVRFPEHPGIVTYGYTFEDAVELSKEALSAALESDFDRDQPLPVSRRPKAKNSDKVIFVSLEPEIRMAYLLRSWREASGLSQKQLALRLGISFQAYQRMERPGRSNLTVATLQRIAHALNKALVLDVRDAHAA